MVEQPKKISFVRVAFGFVMQQQGELHLGVAFHEGADGGAQAAAGGGAEVAIMIGDRGDDAGRVAKGGVCLLKGKSAAGAGGIALIQDLVAGGAIHLRKVTIGGVLSTTETVGFGKRRFSGA